MNISNQSRVFTVYCMLQHRGKAKPRNILKKPTSYTTKKAKEVRRWDNSYSRNVVGWEVQANETGEQAAALLEYSVWAEKC
ncbi:hypothetical protein H4J68_17050 [Colwellia sp. MB3u-28]|uniref:hypothetical protein n=1 Tax=unclassified Colwellia TaxID=196834 RepID=UPI0015F3DE71|nr:MULTISPECIES: hypothetical protein [unclassified Colwellia]MBA6257666.1 hypothetical protein [Colwellia sp. MB3u-28]MBA6259423.1 hypothetical protein [Colwellia sp. MB3u-41]MBA6304374.1 hypothetical protein [Colwellia sp. MB02u-14]